MEANNSVDTNTFEHHFVSDNTFRVCVFRELNEIRKKEHLCDVVIVTDIGNHRFAAHRVILAASSRYFHKLYIGTTLARYSRETMLSGIGEELLEKLLNYIYTSEICINGDNVRAIIHAAFSLGMDLLIQECEEYLGKHLHSGNCIEMMALAENYSCESLLQKSKLCITEHFLKLRGTQPFYRMSADQLQIIIADDDLNITKEEEVYEALISWIRYDFERRKGYLKTLLSHVRLSCLSRRYLVSTVEREPLVMGSDFCKGLVVEALNLKITEKRVSSAMLSNKRKRRYVFPSLRMYFYR
jgi:hypothetical protein